MLMFVDVCVGVDGVERVLRETRAEEVVTCEMREIVQDESEEGGLCMCRVWV